MNFYKFQLSLASFSFTFTISEELVIGKLVWFDSSDMAGPGATSYGIGGGNSPASYSSYGSASSYNPWAGTIPTRGKPGGGAGSCPTASGLGGWRTDSTTYSAMIGPGAGSYVAGPWRRRCVVRWTLGLPRRARWLWGRWLG